MHLGALLPDGAAVHRHGLPDARICRSGAILLLLWHTLRDNTMNWPTLSFPLC